MKLSSALAAKTADSTRAVESTPAAAPRFYRPELDGLRFLAFLGVFVHHAFPQTPDWYAWQGFAPPVADAAAAFVRAGGFGVDLFFVLSAFLITELLLREHELHGHVSIPAFLARRALRIWPLFFFFVASSLLADRLLLDRPGLTSGYVLAFLALAGNWACAFEGYPDSVAAPLWSVSIEEQFYLAFPVALARMGPGRLRAFALVLLVVGAASRVLTVVAGTQHPAVWCSTLCRVDTIGVGILLCLTLRTRPRWEPRRLTRLLLGGGGLLLWMAVELATPVAEQTLVGVSVGYPMIYLGAAGMLLSTFGSGSLLASRPFVALGRVSYGLYVYHVLALALAGVALQRVLGVQPQWYTFVLLGFGITVVLAMTSYRFLEAPFLRLKERFTLVPSRS